MPKPIFDRIEKLILFNDEAVRPDGVLVLDVVRDIYSPAQDFLSQSENMDLDEFCRAEGGQVLPSGIRMPIYIILASDWKIKPPINCSAIEIQGNILSEDDSSVVTVRRDGYEVSTYEALAPRRRRLGKWYVISLSALAIAGAIFFYWILKSPREPEPYASFLLTLVTFIQIATQSRRE